MRRNIPANQISQHEIRVYEAVKDDGGWLTAREIGVKADVAARTSRAHAATLSSLGVFDVAKVFGGYRYRIKTELEPMASEYVGQIEAAKRVLS
jgi:predicted DNA-binding transcriptional regulator